MTYVFITSTNAWGGIERKMLMMLNKLSGKGHRVHLLLVRNGVVPYESELSAQVIVDRIRKIPGDLFLASKVRHFLTKIDQPVLILFKLNDAHLFPAIKKGHPMLLAYFVISSTLSKGLNGNRRRASRVTQTLNSMNKLICVSRGVSQHIISSYGISPAKVVVVYNPLIDKAAMPRADECDHPWLRECKPTVPTFISAGRLVDAKDFPALILAFAKIRKSRECRLIILGEGLLRPRLESLVEYEALQECVSLPGFVDNPRAYIRRASVFVLSSRNEGLGNILVEALETGIRVISTDCPNGPREILEDGKLGTLVPPGDVNALANAMLVALESPKPPLLDVLASLRRFDADAIADRYIELTQSDFEG